MKMKKRVLFESVMISALFVVLMSVTVLAGYPGPDEDEDYDYDDHGWGSYAYSYVKAWYSDPDTYDSEYFYSRRYAGSAQNYGTMYYCYFIDQVYFQGYVAGNTHSSSSGIDCTLVAAYTVAYFEKDDTIDSCEALAVRQIY